MQQFDLSIWLKDKSRKVVTRDGRPARIVCCDRLGNYPIISCIKESDNYEYVETHKIDGSTCSAYKNKNDLFFADIKDELTEFEKELYTLYMCVDVVRQNYSKEEVVSWVKTDAPNLLDLARNELTQDISDFEIYEKRKINYEKTNMACC